MDTKLRLEFPLKRGLGEDGNLFDLLRLSQPPLGKTVTVYVSREGEPSEEEEKEVSDSENRVLFYSDELPLCLFTCA
jgi:hypothetical protein